MKRTLKLKLPPNITVAQKARLDAVAAMADERIDYSDAPFPPDSIWVKTGELPDAKQQITLRIDANVGLLSAHRTALPDAHQCSAALLHGSTQGAIKVSARLSFPWIDNRKLRGLERCRVARGRDELA